MTGLRQPLIWVTALAAGCSAPPAVVVTVEDPFGLASDAAFVAAGPTLDDLEHLGMRGRTFPLTLTVVVRDPPQPLWLEAQRADFVALARNRAVLDPSSAPRVVVELLAACGISDSVGAACVRNDGTGLPGICTPTGCIEPRCGDGYTEAGEECDDGPSNSDSEPNRCRTDCTSHRCGDGVVDSTEACDDGNDIDGDGCLSAEHPTPCQLNICGDGVRNPATEECDDGNPIDEDSCLSASHPTPCTSNVCGDGVLNPAGEDCDDGNTNLNDRCHDCRITTWTPSIIVGMGTGGPPRDTLVRSPTGIVADLFGNIYVGDGEAATLWRFDRGADVVTSVLPLPVVTIAVAIDGVGDVFFCGFDGFIWRIDALTGEFSLIGGGGSDPSDGIDATRALLQRPVDLHHDGIFMLYVADTEARKVRRINLSDGTIETVAGNGTACAAGTPCGDGGQARLAQLSRPQGITVAAVTSLLIADQDAHRVRAVQMSAPYENNAALIVTVAGTGQPCTVTGCGDGGSPLLAQLSGPTDVAFSNGSFFVSEAAGRVRVVSPDLTSIVTIAGTGEPGYGGDGGPAVAAQLSFPFQLAFERDDALLITDTREGRVRRVTFADTDDYTTGTIDTLIGRPIDGSWTYPGATVGYRVHGATSVATTTGAGSLWLAEAWRLHRLELSDRDNPRTWQIETVAGGAARCTSWTDVCGDGASATRASFGEITGVAEGSNGTVMLLELFWNPDGWRLRTLSPGGSPTAYVAATLAAGPSSAGGVGDGGPLSTAGFAFPVALSFDNSGSLLVADAGDDRVRRVNFAGSFDDTAVVETLAGTSTRCTTGPCGDGGAAKSATLGAPTDLAVSSTGEIFVAGFVSNRIRRFAPGKTIETVAGTGTAATTCGGAGDATAVALGAPSRLTLRNDSELLVADVNGTCVRRVDFSAPTPGLETIAGANGAGFAGDGGPLAGAGFSVIMSMASGPFDDVFLVDSGIGLRRARIAVSDDPTSWTIRTIVGNVIPRGNGPLSAARLTEPTAVIRDPTAPERWLVAEELGFVALVDEAAGYQETVLGYANGFDPANDPQPAAFASPLAGASGLAAESATGRIFVSSKARGHVYGIDTTVTPWTVERVFGNAPGFVDGDIATAELSPERLVYDAENGLLYFSQGASQLVRVLDTATGNVRTLAGRPLVAGFFGEGDPARETLFYWPGGLALSPEGGLYVADERNHRVRRLAPVEGVIGPESPVTTVLGTGTPGSGGEGSPARSFDVDSPEGVVFDAFGNLLVVGRSTVRMVTAGADGIVTGDDEVLTIYGQPPREKFPQTITRCLVGVAVGEDDEIVVIDKCLGFLVRLRRGN